MTEGRNEELIPVTSSRHLRENEDILCPEVDISQALQASEIRRLIVPFRSYPSIDIPG